MRFSTVIAVAALSASVFALPQPNNGEVAAPIEDIVERAIDLSERDPKKKKAAKGAAGAANQTAAAGISCPQQITCTQAYTSQLAMPTAAPRSKNVLMK